MLMTQVIDRAIVKLQETINQHKVGLICPFDAFNHFVDAMHKVQDEIPKSECDMWHGGAICSNTSCKCTRPKPLKDYRSDYIKGTLTNEKLRDAVVSFHASGRLPASDWLIEYTCDNFLGIERLALISVILVWYAK